MNSIKHLASKTGKAIGEFKLIDEGDKILVGLSGGKDSWTLLHVLYHLKKKAPVNFDLYPVTVNPGFPGFITAQISEYIKKNLPDLNFTTESTNISEIIDKHITPGKSICSFCSRLRRGVLYRIAIENNFNKIALGHHADDFIETLLLNQFFNGRIKAMTPLLYSDNGKNTVIRPLCYVNEEKIIDFIKTTDFPITESKCPAREEDRNRVKIKNLLAELSHAFPGIKSSILSSISSLDTRHLMDSRYWDNKESK